MSYSCVPDGLARAFYKYGKFVGRPPLPFLLLPLIVTCLFAVGITKIEPTSDIEYLYVPVGARSLEDRAYFDEYFGQDEKTRYSAERLIFLKGFIRIHINEQSERNVLTNDVLDAINSLDDMITSYELSYDGGRTRMPTCVANGTELVSRIQF